MQKYSTRKNSRRKKAGQRNREVRKRLEGSRWETATGQLSTGNLHVRFFYAGRVFAHWYNGTGNLFVGTLNSVNKVDRRFESVAEVTAYLDEMVPT